MRIEHGAGVGGMGEVSRTKTLKDESGKEIAYIGCTADGPRVQFVAQMSLYEIELALNYLKGQRNELTASFSG